MPQSAYVLAIVGESPSVLTELIWWLCVRERRALAGIEVWATAGGAAQLRELVDGEGWSGLVDQTGPLPPLLPQGTDPSSGHGFRIHRFEREGALLRDVRTQAEAAAVSATLHDRVRGLRAGLDDHVQVVGSLAGGRKTASAALQTAFSLQAGPRDRLVHVLLEERLEAWLRRERRMGEYVAPSAAWEAASGVAAREQVAVYEVPFPRVRYLVPRRLTAALAELEWEAVWPVLERNMGLEVRGELTRVGWQTWKYRIVHLDGGEEAYSKRLGQRAGAVLAAMALTGPAASAGDLVAWLDANEVGWAPTIVTGPKPPDRCEAVRKAVGALRTALEDVPLGMERLAPAAKGFCVEGITVIGVEKYRRG